MKLLHNKTATIYTYARNTNMVSSYTLWDSFSCNIQPVGVNDWFTWEMVYKTKKMFTEYTWLIVWEKIVIDWINYIIKEFESWDGKYGKYYMAFIQKSEWT